MFSVSIDIGSVEIRDVIFTGIMLEKIKGGAKNILPFGKDSNRNL